MVALALDSSAAVRLTLPNALSVLSYLLDKSHIEKTYITDVVFYEMTGKLPTVARADVEALTAAGRTARAETTEDGPFIERTKAIAAEYATGCANRPGKAKRFLRLFPRHTDGCLELVETEIGQRHTQRIMRALDKSFGVFREDTPVTIYDLAKIGAINLNDATTRQTLRLDEAKPNTPADTPAHYKYDALFDQATCGGAQAIAAHAVQVRKNRPQHEGLCFADLTEATRSQLSAYYRTLLTDSLNANETGGIASMMYDRAFVYGVLENTLDISQLLNIAFKAEGMQPLAGTTGQYSPHGYPQVIIDAEARTITVTGDIEIPKTSGTRHFKPSREPNRRDEEKTEATRYPVTYGFDQLTGNAIVSGENANTMAKEGTLTSQHVDRDNVKLVLQSIIQPACQTYAGTLAVRKAARGILGETGLAQLELNACTNHRAMQREGMMEDSFIIAHRHIARDRHNLGETSLFEALINGKMGPNETLHLMLGSDDEMRQATDATSLGDWNARTYLLNKPGYLDIVYRIEDCWRAYKEQGEAPLPAYVESEVFAQLGQHIAGKHKRKERDALAPHYPFLKEGAYQHDPDERIAITYKGKVSKETSQQSGRLGELISL